MGGLDGAVDCVTRLKKGDEFPEGGGAGVDGEDWVGMVGQQAS